MYKNRCQWLVLISVFFFIGCGPTAEEQAETSNSVCLAGTWRFALDRDDAGIEGRWYEQDLKDQIRLPGILQSQGYGDPISTETPWVLSLYDRYWYLRKEYKSYGQSENVRVPFLCQPPRHYLGAAWYQRDIEIPADWQGRRIGLILERARWETTVWVDENKTGSNDSLVAPHEFELGTLSSGKHRLTIRVDNRMKMGYRPDAHSVSDSMGSTWNGIVGKIEMISTTPVWIDHVRAYPDIFKKSVRLEVHLGNISGRAGKGTLQVDQIQSPISWTAEGGHGDIEVFLGEDALHWNEFNPVLYHLSVKLKGDQADDSMQVNFGLRKIGTDGHNLLINGQKTQFRGTNSSGDFPITGYPATDMDYWRKLFKTCKEWGINHVRFHSFCPPEAAFEAADEIGIYLQPEAGMWNVISPGTEMEKRMYEETDRMLRAYGNHPSFVLLSPSNEPKGNWQESLPKWVEHYRQEDPRRLYTTGTGWPIIEYPGHVEGADFLAVHRIGRRRIRGRQAWFGGDYLRSVRGVDVPIIVHEVGQWCAYPDFDIIDKFTGYMQPGNYEIFRDSMAKAGLLDKDKEFVRASGQLQLACYKEEIEANLRTPGLAGFQLLDLHDYVGQGTALVGLLDAFWEEKGYVTASEWRRFCNTTVPLAVLKDRIFTSSDAFDVEIQASHYGEYPLGNTVVYWYIRDSKENILQEGEWPVDTIPLGSGVRLGQIKADLSELPVPGAYYLVVGFKGTEFENDWDFWVYPEKPAEAESSNVLMTRSFDEAIEAMDAGKKVLFMPRYNELQWQSPPVESVPIFWNRLMGPSWERFLGLVCDPGHSALAEFPTDAYYDWQWQGVFGRFCRAINMDSLDGDLQPIVQIIDDWNRNYKLGALFECKIGKGRLMICAADLERYLDNRPVAAQFRKSLLDYMTSEAFNPAVEITPEQFSDLRFDNQIMRKLGAAAMADEGDRAGRAANAIDGNPNTYWSTASLRGESKKHPHELVIKFSGPVEMTGLLIMNRQSHRQHLGDIRDYVIEMSEDGQEWLPVAEGQLESTFDPQEIDFGKKISANYIKVRALSGFGDDISASLAEVAVIYAGTKSALQTAEEDAAYKKVATATEEMFEDLDVLGGSSNPSAIYLERVTADSESRRYPVTYALDGDPRTFWHTQIRDVVPEHPHWLMLEFKKPIKISELRYLPRQDDADGRINDYRIEISSDGSEWQHAAKGNFEGSRSEQIVRFDKTIRTKYLKLIADSETQGQVFTSIAELTIIAGQ